MSPATDKHPAQVEKVVREIQIGTYSEVQQSGEMQPGEKADLLGRVDKLIESVKKARSKANEAEVDEAKIGGALFDYIHKRSK